MMHPNAIDLEAVACGDSIPAVDEHLRQCELCRLHIERLRAAVAEIPAVPPAPRPRPILRALPLTALPAAAALLLWLNARPDRVEAPVSTLPTASPTEVARPSEVVADPGTVRFKGRLQLAVIRERDGHQERFATAVRVRPGDRLRLELAVDERELVTGGILGDDGAFIEVLAPKRRDVGAHLAERAVRVDARPIGGYAMAGTLEAMETARRTGDLRDVASIRLEWEHR